MKISTTLYRTYQHNKSTRLSIELKIEDGGGDIIDSSAVLQIQPLDYFWGKVPSATFSLLYLSAIVYAVDRSVDRNIYSINGWSREFDLDIIIPDYQLFAQYEKEFNSLLSFLTGDYWSCHFTGPATVQYNTCNHISYFDGINQVNLFSGGLDSLIGAIDFMTDHPDSKLFLASHYDSYMHGPLADQERLKNVFQGKFNNRFCYLPAILVMPSISSELSCRSRSFVFLSIAAIVASYAQCKIVVPENGSVSLNFPLSHSRRASCSTRTTHPVFMQKFKSLINLLGINVDVENPYEKMTKGEMVQRCSDKNYLLSVLSQSNSCGKRGMHQFMFDNPNATHCGHCMPCMYRKAALIGEQDTTTYGNRLITLYNKRGLKVSEDFYAMLNFLKKDLSREDIRKELIIAGMNGFEDLDDYVDLVIRTRLELKTMLYEANDSSILRYLNL